MDAPAPHRILVVDDNEILRTLLAQALESGGYVALAADSAESALDVVRFDPPDLCVVDEVMPGMKGSDLIRVLRASPDPRLRSMPIVGLSGVAGGDRALLEAGADVAIRKPFAEAPLLELVRRLLARVPVPALTLVQPA
ncbi:response regulator receiver protein [Anaeromyxobacter dehalogenans 2CP-1]|uniref:Response regulator receiver protein n=1 Tax=Anaeromyxobacter dehalogenans (strain ATCC BAA-258 / DSM 21875 / 2CP-1) TaxID=455488 RepID=B8JGP3_ANAD2|nr:response regulator [Anaeromyxobacter dehalogenans]ACL66530.1 response regulator receiver protein [Anaeromyxobacter dehalogenans 2CP-1]